jgi:hypothetical protein
MSEERPRIMIFQPFIPEGAAIDYRVLGVQFWLTDQLSSLGFEAASAMFSDPRVRHERRLIAVTPPTEQQLLDTLNANGCHFAVLTRFELDATPRLTVAQLFNTRGLVGRIEIGGRNDVLPAAAHELLTNILRGIGLEVEAPAWQTAYGTGDIGAATNYLSALGAHSLCDQGFRAENARGSLQALRSAIAAGMAPAMRLLPHLVASLRRTGSADETLCRDEVREALARVKVTPPDWAPMLSELGVTPTEALN